MKKHHESSRISAFRVALSLALTLISTILIVSSFGQSSGTDASNSMSSVVRSGGSNVSPLGSVSFTFTTIDVPGATNTILAGINNLGQIVGGDLLSNGTRHGFRDVGGTFTTIDDPNATAGNEATDINTSGQIVGSYDFTDPNHLFEGAHGFLFSGGVFTPIDFPGPGVTSTSPSGINDSGDVVGVYRMNSPGNGFLFSSGVYTTVNVPPAMGCCTHANGINNAGQIVGQYKFPDDNAPPQGFLDISGTFTTVDFPGAAVTSLADINNFGAIVGSYTTSANQTFGFLDAGGNFFTIAFPGATQTQCLRINDDGEIVGYYIDTGGVLHGFLATMTAPVAQSAVSRKTHGGAGAFDINLPLTGTTGVECRTTGGTNDYTMVVTFASNVTVTGNPQAQVTVGTGCVGNSGACTGNVTVNGNLVTVPLTNIVNVQTINVRINGVNGAADAPATDFDIPMSILIGDTNGNRSVNAADVSQTKSRLGQTVSASNFRSDVNANGGINAADTAIVKLDSGTSLPP